MSLSEKKSAVCGVHARTASCSSANRPCSFMPPRPPQLREQIHQAGAAEPCGLPPPITRVSTAPSSADAHALDRAVERRHAAGHAAAFEGRTRRAGGGDHAVPVADDDLGIRADVQQRGDLVGL